jgi:hypothetical protein
VDFLVLFTPESATRGTSKNGQSKDGTFDFVESAVILVADGEDASGFSGEKAPQGRWFVRF